MSSMVCALMYRVFRSHLFVGSLIGFSIFCIVVLGCIWVSQQPWFTIETGGHFTNMLSFWGSAFIAGSVFALFISLIVANFVVSDFKSGFIKNMVYSTKSRAFYIVSYLVIELILTSFFLMLGIIIFSVGLHLIGNSLVWASVGDTIQWLVEVLLCVVAYSSFNVFLAVASRSNTLCAVGGIFASLGVIENVLKEALLYVSANSLLVGNFFDNYLATSISLLGSGRVVGNEVYLASIVTILVFVAISLVIMRRRSLA